jgi:hypothetical protein
VVCWGGARVRACGTRGGRRCVRCCRLGGGSVRGLRGLVAPERRAVSYQDVWGSDAGELVRSGAYTPHEAVGISAVVACVRHRGRSRGAVAVRGVARCGRSCRCRVAAAGADHSTRSASASVDLACSDDDQPRPVWQRRWGWCLVGGRISGLLVLLGSTRRGCRSAPGRLRWCRSMGRCVRPAM